MTRQSPIYSLVLTLIPTEETTIEATTGRQAHAAFLHTIRAADPDLAEALHAPDVDVRPFTVSRLIGLPRTRNHRLVLSPNQDCWMRLTLLRPEIGEQFLSHFLHTAPTRPTLRLGHAELLIDEIISTPEGHDWAGYTTWHDLVDRAQPDPEVAVEFVSPTAFGFGQKEWGKKAVLLPRPILVFGNLLRTWNALAPAALHVDADELSAYVEEHVVVSRIDRLKTAVFKFKHSLQIGFVGAVTYRLMADSEVMRRQLNTLADFAFYAGVGMKTTMGMGQTRRVVG